MLIAAMMRKNGIKGSTRSIQRVTNRLFYTDMGRILVSALFGAALAAMFQRVCKGDKCIIIEAPPMKDIEPYVYKVGDKCYRYQARIVKCTAAAETTK